MSLTTINSIANTVSNININNLIDAFAEIQAKKERREKALLTQDQAYVLNKAVEDVILKNNMLRGIDKNILEKIALYNKNQEKYTIRQGMLVKITNDKNDQYLSQYKNDTRLDNNKWQFSMINQKLTFNDQVFLFRSGKFLDFLKKLFELYKSKKITHFQIEDICYKARIGDDKETVKYINRSLRALKSKADKLHCRLPFKFGAHQIQIYPSRFKY